MTPTDLPAALPAATQVENRRMVHRIDSLEHAIAAFPATDGALAATQILIVIGVLAEFAESELTEAQSDAAYLLGARCLMHAYRYVTKTTATAPPRGLADYYIPAFVRAAEQVA